MRCYTISNTVEKTVKTMRFSFLIFVTQFNMIDKSQTVSNPLPLCPKSLAAQPHQSKPAPVDSPFPHPFVLPPCPKSPLAPPPQEPTQALPEVPGASSTACPRCPPSALVTSLPVATPAGCAPRLSHKPGEPLSHTPRHRD